MSQRSTNGPPGRYRTVPDPAQTDWPGGVPYIIGNEGCERFSFYGMKSILQVHLTALFVAMGLVEEAAGEQAQAMIHLWIAGVYALPMIGAIIADRLLGKYRTIMSLSLVYCLGHLVLAFAENSIGGMSLGLGLIAIGSGGIKPCVSAHVGDQFGKGNWRLVGKVFQAFYFIINFGSFFATLLIPWTRERFGAPVAFGIPGILMFVATVWFWMGRHKFIHVPAKPGGKLGLLDALSAIYLFAAFAPFLFAQEWSWGLKLGVFVGSLTMGLTLFACRQSAERDDGFLAVLFHAVRTNWQRIGRRDFFRSAEDQWGREVVEGPRAVLRIMTVFLFVSVFWALFDQHASSWIRQAKMMNLTFKGLPVVGDLTILPSQFQSLNPLLVMLLIPFCSWVLYPGLGRLGLNMTPLRRMTGGMLMAGFAFVAVALIQAKVDAGTIGQVHIGWQAVPYLIITLAEVMVSITGLEFAYTQAPPRMKSTVMGFWLLTVSLGNVLVAFVTKLPDMGLQKFFWTFAGFMGTAGVLFGVRAAFYTVRDYRQGDEA